MADSLGDDAAPEDEEGAVEVHHRPKPVQGWRELLSEVAVIGVGVLLALLAEQAVDAIHWAHKVDEAEHAMLIELSTDDGPQAFARAATARCYDDQLKAVIDAVEAGRDRAEVARLTDAYKPPLRTWDRHAWDAAVASDIASHVGAERLALWGRVYDVMSLLGSQAAKETENIDLMTGGLETKGPLSPDAADRTIRAARALRRINKDIAGVSLLTLLWSEPVHATPSPASQAEILADARRSYGGCVVVPNPHRAPANPSR